MELQAQVETLQKDIAQLLEVTKEKAEKGQTEYKELSDKVVELQKELTEKKIQFSTQSGSPATKLSKEQQKRMDQLFIAKHLCVNKETGAFDQKAWDKVVAVEEYADTIKAFGDVDAIGTAAQTGVTDTGNFIPVGFSSQLQEEIFLSLQVAGIFGRINMPNATFNIPFAPGRLIAKKTLEGATPGKDKPQDAKITLTAGKIMSVVEFTDELEADSIVAILDLCRKQLIGGFALAQDTMALNGDTGTTIYAPGSLGAADVRTMVNGIRRDALYATGKAAASVNASTGKCNLTNIRLARAAMGKYGVNPSDLVLLCSIADYNNLLGDTSANVGALYQSLYSYGNGAVILNGELGRIDGIPIVITELMPNKGVTDAADAPAGVLATGKTDLTTLANNTFSTFALVNKNGWLWGDRKEFALELWRNPLNQTTNLIGSQRLDLQKVTGVASTPSAVGINYSN